MSGPAPLFREIHRLRRFAGDLQEHLDRAPRTLRLQKEKVTRQEEAQKENLEAIKRLKIDIHEKEVSLKSTHGQIAKYIKQMDTAASTKEMEAFKHQIAAARESSNKLEDEILAAMADMEERTAQVPVLEKAVQQAHEDFKRFETGHNEKTADWRTQLEQTQTKLKEVESQLPEDVRGQYNRIVAAMGADGLSATRGRTCVACATEITAQNYQDLKLQRFVPCKACGRILYPPEEAPVPS
jgi:predicted  nucleic acid-binding Zn-ribbon protein